jgi:hypothetical protein
LKLFQEWGEGRDNGEWWRGLIQLQYIWYIVRTSESATMYHQHNNKNIQKQINE